MSEKQKGVLDPQWEDALRAGQESEGARGSVEAELAVVHLFRHIAGPETLEPEAARAVWSEVAQQLEAEAGFTPWWRRMFDWRVGVGVAVAAAAAAVVVISSGPAPRGAVNPESVAQLGGAAAMSVTLQAQFDMLAPHARAEIGGALDEGRVELREDLIASLKPSRTSGGAP
ncbi:MAG: hypothetical protein KUG77_29985 [Nannocystaceae bacterium]|nr:hypothetical protein [Nannocystaceae bacterium]